MRTTGNVMGVQAQFILERIDETWKILKRRMQDAQGGYLFTDKAHAAATAAEAASAEGAGKQMLTIRCWSVSKARSLTITG